MFGREISVNSIVGQVVELFISKKGNSLRENKKEILLKKEGIVDDKFYAKDQQRSVLLSTIDSYTLAKNIGIEMEYGLLGENILLDYNPYHLTVGTQLKVGMVILEITQNCTICNHLSSIDKKLPKLLRNDRGIFVKVIEEGKIYKGDKVYLLG